MRRLGFSARLAGLTAALLLLVCGSASAKSITFADLSNNDPTYNMAAIKRAGHPAVVLKVNQGIGFLDHTFYYMAIAAKRAGLCVGGYDFDQEYTAAETYAFIARLHAAGIYRNTRCTLPPTLDVEFGIASRAGLEHQLAVLFREYGRAQIYSGAWYWLPHFGCWVPPKVHLWLSGYPFAPTLCGMQQWQYVIHQYTDHGFNGVFSSDMNVWRGSSASFPAYVQAGSPATLRTRLINDRKRRAKLHSLLAKRQCRTIHGPKAYRACPVWARHGQEVIADEKKLKHRLGIR